MSLISSIKILQQQEKKILFQPVYRWVFSTRHRKSDSIFRYVPIYSSSGNCNTPNDMKNALEQFLVKTINALF